MSVSNAGVPGTGIWYSGLGTNSSLGPLPMRFRFSATATGINSVVVVSGGASFSIGAGEEVDAARQRSREYHR